ncbi:MAG: VOC family protein [Actinobacteria bacterium]|nr:VOC family protein [Actinomycetota bacterium]
MGYAHIGIATGDLTATHRFYTEAMGFELVHVEGADTDAPGGWLRHAFYDTGDGTLLAFQELHDDRAEGVDFAISRGLGLPSWVNHLAFRAASLDALHAARDRLLRFGCDVVGMAHARGPSIYAEDPNGNVVEWSYTAIPFTDAERRQAAARLCAPDLIRDAVTEMEFFLAADDSARESGQTGEG